MRQKSAGVAGRTRSERQKSHSGIAMSARSSGLQAVSGCSGDWVMRCAEGWRAASVATRACACYCDPLLSWKCCVSARATTLGQFDSPDSVFPMSVLWHCNCD